MKEALRFWFLKSRWVRSLRSTSGSVSRSGRLATPDGGNTRTHGGDHTLNQTLSWLQFFGARFLSVESRKEHARREKNRGPVFTMTLEWLLCCPVFIVNS